MAEGGGGDPLVLAELVEHGHQHIFQYAQHVRLTGKGHFHIQLIEFTGGTVGTGVLVPEAGGDLEVTVKAGGHQQLLELLGRLRQSVELAGVVPGGNQVIPGALGGGRGEDGGGDLQKALLGHQPPQLGHHLAAQDDVGLHGGVAQVEEAVFEPGVLVGVLALVDLKGQLVVNALAQHLDFFGDNLDLAGGELGVLALPLPDEACDGDGGLLVDGLDELHHFFGFNDHLGGAVEIPQDAEREVPANLPDILQPANDGYGLARVGKTQLAAVMGSGLHHG